MARERRPTDSRGRLIGSSAQPPNRRTPHVRLPSGIIAPGARRRWRSWRTCGRASFFEPAAVWRPARCNRSLSAIGKPASGPRSTPPCRAAIGGVRYRTCVIVVDVDERMHAIVERGDAVETGIDDLARRRLPAARRRERSASDWNGRSASMDRKSVRSRSDSVSGAGELKCAGVHRKRSRRVMLASFPCEFVHETCHCDARYGAAV